FVCKLPDGFSGYVEQAADLRDGNQTIVKLKGYKGEFEKYFRKKRLSTLKNDLIRHFMSYLMFHPSVQVLLKDSDEFVSINRDDMPTRV
ncbi:hypothetical protein, partial [Enterococcus faecium]|uniref:hypothetical protein n=1 Tax=Enterococcus faecium TaxID=1352 RepID=UPI003F430179